MNTTTYNLLMLTLIISTGVWGCALDRGTEQADQQADIGLGIVLGTRGYQEVQKELALPDAYAQAVEGQVTKIEGAAYLIRNIAGNVQRLPVDQNTAIDRPAHIGDWIQAFLDERGRAIFIRNIDKEFQVGDKG